MRRSKLQVCVAILQTLADYGEAIPTHITYHTYLNNSSVNKYLGVLVQHKLVREINVGKKTRRAYAITRLGMKALQTANQIDETLNVFNA